MSLLSYLSLLNIPLQAFEICARYHWKEVPTRMESWETGTAGHRVPILSLFHPPPPSTLSPEIVSKLFFFFFFFTIATGFKHYWSMLIPYSNKSKERSWNKRKCPHHHGWKTRVAHCFYLFFDSRSSSNLPGENVEGETRSESFLILENCLLSFLFDFSVAIQSIGFRFLGLPFRWLTRAKSKWKHSIRFHEKTATTNKWTIRHIDHHLANTYFIVTKTLMMSLKTKLSHASPLRSCKKMK